MSMLVLNLLLAFAYCLMFGGFDIWTLTSGFVVSFVLLAAVTNVTRRDGRGTYGGRLLKLASFGGYFLRILFTANWQVAREVLSPKTDIHPRIIRYDITGLTDVQVATLANAITLTPGTLAVDVDEPHDDRGDASADEPRMLYIHCMFAADREATVAEIDELRARLLRGVFE